MSNEDNSKWVTTFFGKDHLPTALEFPDGSQAKFSNATQTTVDITLFNSSGKLIAGPVTQAADVAKLLQLKDTLEKDGVQSGLRTICIPKWLDNIIWLVFQGFSAESCATSAAAALVAPETVVPIAMALWACGSLVLGSVDKMSESSNGKTLFGTPNKINNFSKTGVACKTMNSKGCLLGFSKFAYSEAKNSEEVSVQRDCNSADTPTKPTDNVPTQGFGTIDFGPDCGLTLKDTSSFKREENKVTFVFDYSLNPDLFAEMPPMAQLMLVQRGVSSDVRVSEVMEFFFNKNPLVIEVIPFNNTFSSASLNVDGNGCYGYLPLR